MLYLIDIAWQRRTPHPDKPATGRTTLAISARYPKRAIADAQAQFRQKYGNNLAITSATEKPDPAGIFSR
jgi:hypothetical protein